MHWLSLCCLVVSRSPHSCFQNILEPSQAKTHLDELLLIRLSLIVAAILALVRMKLQRQLLVCLLDFFAAGALPQTEHGVVVSLLLSLSLSTTALLLSPSAVLGARALEEQEEDQRRGQHRRTPLRCCHGGLLAVVRIIMTTIAGEATWNLPCVRDRTGTYWVAAVSKKAACTPGHEECRIMYT